MRRHRRENIQSIKEMAFSHHFQALAVQQCENNTHYEEQGVVCTNAQVVLHPDHAEPYAFP